MSDGSERAHEWRYDLKAAYAGRASLRPISTIEAFECRGDGKQNIVRKTDQGEVLLVVTCRRCHGQGCERGE